MSSSCCHAPAAATAIPTPTPATTPPPACPHHDHAAGHGSHGAAPAAVHAAHAGHAHGSGWGDAARVTLHCLTGCAIGEWLGLAIGVSLGWSIGATITLAVTLAFLFGFALTIIPMMRRGLGFMQALRIVWLGELVSISVMELVMNVVDYQLGGMGPGMSLLHPQYWIAFGVAAASGYLAALPINKWLLGRNLKKCH